MERSPTAERLFNDVHDWVTRSAGTSYNAVQRISQELIEWADKVIVMEQHHFEKVIEITPEAVEKFVILGIEDRYYRFSPELVGRLIIEMSKRFNLDAWIKTKFLSH